MALGYLKGEALSGGAELPGGGWWITLTQLSSTAGLSGLGSLHKEQVMSTKPKLQVGAAYE